MWDILIGSFILLVVLLIVYRLYKNRNKGMCASCPYSNNGKCNLK